MVLFVTRERGGCCPAVHPELVEHLGDVPGRRATHTSEGKGPAVSSVRGRLDPDRSS